MRTSRPARPTAQQMKAAADLDQYYTQRPVAAACWDLLLSVLDARGIAVADISAFEPSAGDGAFLDTAPAGLDLQSMDLKPAHSHIKQGDFLDVSCPNPFSTKSSTSPSCHVVIGNPPFGRKATLASAFISRAAEMRADVIAFVLPLQFRKWSAQSKVPSNYRLLADHDLPEEAFEILGKPYRVRCSFQVWVIDSLCEKESLSGPALPDLRMKSKPPVTHADFTAYQFNRTQEAEKFFDYDWDFAVPRQGYVDYTTRAYHSKDCDRKQQWIFFKAHSPRALRVLLSLDFTALSLKNIGIPGFGKADVVAAYEAALLQEPV